MCIAKIKKWLGISAEWTAEPARAVVIKYPEEPVDPTRTAANTDLNAVLDQWETGYNVPAAYRDYWKTRVEFELVDDPRLVAESSDCASGRHIRINPKWLNPGVIAHEQAHNSYALLTPAEKAAFSADYTPLKTTDPLVQLVLTTYPYSRTNDIEGHAEMYRYLGDTMPRVLKKYYPRLF